MSKTAQRDMSPPGIAAIILEQMKPEAIIESYGRWLKQVEEVQRALVGNAQQSTEAGWELAQQLTTCTDPGEAMQLCNEWVNARREAFFADSQRLSDLVLAMWGRGDAAPQPPTTGRANLTAVQRPAAAGE